jgi:hypothetical protein
LSGPLDSAKVPTAVVVGGTRNVTPPAPADGQSLSLQQDANGNLLVNVAVNSGGGGGTTNVNIADVSGNPPALTNPLPVELSDGTQEIGVPSNPLSVTFPTSQHVITDTGSTTAVTGNVTVVQPTASNLNAQVQGAAAADAAASGNPVLVGGVDAAGNIQELPIADAETTTPAQVLQVGGAVTTAAPTYTTGRTDPFSLDTAGNLRVLATTAAGTTTAVVGTLTNNNAAPAATEVGVLPALANAVSPLWTEGKQVLESVDLNGGQRTIAGNIPEITAAWTSATGTNTALTLTPILGYGTVLVTLASTSTITGGQLTFEASDTAAGTNWYPVRAATNGVIAGGQPPAFITTFIFTANSFTSFQIDVTGYAAFRVRLNIAISGTATVNVGIQASSIANPSTVSVSGTVTNNPISTSIAVADNLLNVVPYASGQNIGLFVGMSNYGGAFSGAADAARQGWSKMRTPTVFRTVQATASGNTAVWTPGTGNKFRLLKLFVELTDNGSLASGGVLTINFQDATTSINISFDVFVPTTAVTTVIGDGLEQELDLGAFGILSAAANNVLNVNLSSALATGNVRVIAMGTEE